MILDMKHRPLWFIICQQTSADLGLFWLSISFLPTFFPVGVYQIFTGFLKICDFWKQRKLADFLISINLNGNSASIWQFTKKNW